MSCTLTCDFSVLKNLEESVMEHEIDTMRINSIYQYESTMKENGCDSFFEAENNSDTNNKSSDKGFFSKIIDTMVSLLNKIIDSFKNLFKPKDEVTAEEFFNSQQGKMKMEYDMEAIRTNAEAEVRKGRKLIQKISQTTNIDDAEVEEFVDNARGFLSRHKLKIAGLITAGVGYGMYKKTCKSSEKLKQQAAELKKQKEFMNNSSSLQQKAIVKVGNAINSIIGAFGTASTVLMKGLSAYTK